MLFRSIQSRLVVTPQTSASASPLRTIIEPKNAAIIEEGACLTQNYSMALPQAQKFLNVGGAQLGYRRCAMGNVLPKRPVMVVA